MRSALRNLHNTKDEVQELQEFSENPPALMSFEMRTSSNDDSPGSKSDSDLCRPPTVSQHRIHLFFHTVILFDPSCYSDGAGG